MSSIFGKNLAPTIAKRVEDQVDAFAASPWMVFDAAYNNDNWYDASESGNQQAPWLPMASPHGDEALYRSLGYTGPWEVASGGGVSWENGMPVFEESTSSLSPELDKWLASKGYRYVAKPDYQIGALQDAKGNIVPGTAWSTAGADDDAFGLATGLAAGLVTGGIGAWAMPAIGNVGLGALAGGVGGASSAAMSDPSDLRGVIEGGVTGAAVGGIGGGIRDYFKAPVPVADPELAVPGTEYGPLPEPVLDITGSTPLTGTAVPPEAPLTVATTPVPGYTTPALGSTTPDPTTIEKLTAFANKNPVLAAKLMGLTVTGMTKMLGIGAGGGGIASMVSGSGGGSQKDFTATPAAALKRTYIAPPAGYRPGVDPEHVYFKTLPPGATPTNKVTPGTGA